MSTTLPFYWNLSSADKEERVDASVKLVSSVLEFQAQFSGPASPAAEASADESDDDDAEAAANGLDELNAEDVRYAIRRLVRGLASPRESSRLGFAVALTELLSRLSTVSAEQIIALVMSSSETQGSMQGHEIRDQYFARLFGFVSVIQSGLLFRNATLPTSGSNRTLAATLTDLQTVVAELIALGEKKSWLRESCWWALSLLLEALSASSVPWKQEAFTWLAKTIYTDNTTWMSEKLAFTITFQRLVPELPWKKLLAPTFHDADMLSSRNVSAVARLLREAPLEAEGSAEASGKASGPWKPQLHYAWTTIFQAYFPSKGSPSPTQSSFQEFYRAAVDESLFSNTASPERKSWGFSVFQLALSTIPAKEVPLLFTQNFMRTWINQLAGQDRALHKTARHVATAVQTVVDAHPAIGFTLVLQLVGRHGSKQFDKITRTKTVETLIASTDVDGVVAYIEYLRWQILEEATSSSDTSAIEAQRLWAVDQLAALVKNTAVPRADLWISTALELIAVHGFFEVSKKSTSHSIVSLRNIPRPAFTPALRKSYRQRFFACLADLTGQSTVVKAADGKLSKKAGAASNGELWLSRAYKLLEQLGAEKHVSPLVVPSSELSELRAKVTKLISRLSTIESDAALGSSALLYSLLLQTYDPDADVSEALETCLESVQKLLPAPTKTKRKSLTKADNAMDVDGETVLPVDEIVDVLIGFLEGSTAFSRSTATFVFGHLTAEVRSSTIDFILKQLDEKNLDDDASSHDEGSEASEEEDDLETLGDIEVLDDSDEESSSADSDDDSAASDDNDDGDEEFDIEADDELRQKIAAALNMKEGDEEEEDDEVVMDDEEMLKLDDQLAAVFRMQQGPKSDKKRADNVKREATHFKNRVLDFLDLFIKNEPTSPLIPPLVMPLIEAIRSARADEGHFTEKATNLINSRIANLKQTPEGFVAGDDIVQSYNELHNLSRKAPSTAFESTLSAASLYLSKVISHAGRAEDAAAAYRVSLRDFVTRKSSRLNPIFFQTWIKRQASVAWLVRDELISLCGTDDAVNGSRQIQAFQLLQGLITEVHSLAQTVPKADITAFFSSCQQLFDATLSKAADSSEGDGLNAKQIKTIIKCALQAVRLSKRVTSSPEEVSAIWKPEAVTALIARFAGNPRFAGSVVALCKQFLGTISGSSKSEKKGTKKGKAAGAEAPVPTPTEDAAAPPAVNGSVKDGKKKKEKRKADGLEGNPEPAPVAHKKKKVKTSATAA